MAMHIVLFLQFNEKSRVYDCAAEKFCSHTLLQIIMFSPTFAWPIVTWPGLFVGSRTLRSTIRRRGIGASAESLLLSWSASHITLAPVSIGAPSTIDNC